MTRRYNPADPAQVKTRKLLDQARRDQERGDWLWLCSDPRGQRIVRGLVRPLLGRSYVAGDAMATALNEGRRDAALAVYAAATQSGFDALAAISAGGQDDERDADTAAAVADGDSTGGE